MKTLTKTVTKIALVLIPAITLSMTATAHDPSMHVKKAEKADCSNMDQSKMDMKDPVALAMMKKCMEQAENSSDKMDHSKMGDKMMDGKMDHSKMGDKMMDGKMDHSKMMDGKMMDGKMDHSKMGGKMDSKTDDSKKDDHDNH